MDDGHGASPGAIITVNLESDDDDECQIVAGPNDKVMRMENQDENIQINMNKKSHPNVGDGPHQQFDSLDFDHCQEMLRVFREKFGLTEFKTNQIPAINAIMLGHDCFILMPTGGGKSLCYQLPALLSSGVTVVVSPLRSLIVDQTQKLLSLGIPAKKLTGDLNREQAARVRQQLINMELRLLYVTPEMISRSISLMSIFTSLYHNKKLVRFVINEAHCVSQWGHDFRRSYKKLNVLREKFSDVPIVALTATATQRTRTDVAQQLLLEPSKIKWFISGLDRGNLIYEVLERDNNDSCRQAVNEILKRGLKNQCGIVYCLTCADCENYAYALSTNGIKAISYHAGLADEERLSRQIRWTNGQVKVICGTIAFGMGIDKADVRFVMHAIMPRSIQGFYQESGRAGRDGELAHCIVMCNVNNDIKRQRGLMAKSTFDSEEARLNALNDLLDMAEFCKANGCRRVLQLRHFGESYDRRNCIENHSSSCDNCRKSLR